MATWTFAAAWTRVTANGLVSWDDVIIQAAYYYIPLALICYYNWQDRSPVQEEERVQIKQGAFSPVGAD